jgi:hypothetical protein
MACAREQEPQIGMLSTHARERLDETCVVLVRPPVGRIEEETLAWGGRRREPLPIQSEVDHADALRR